MKKILLSAALFVFLMFSGFSTSAQCSMCRRVAESNMEAGEVKGRGLNTGILYLMSVPYLMAGVAGFMWWRKKQVAKTTERAD